MGAELPRVGPLVLPLADPRDGQVLEVAAHAARGAGAARGERARAAAELLAGFSALGLDPVLIDTSEPDGDRPRRSSTGPSGAATRRPPVSRRFAHRGARGRSACSSRCSSPAPGSAGGTPAVRRRGAASRLSVTTSLEPRPAFFGDPVTAEIDVDYDPTEVDRGQHPRPPRLHPVRRRRRAPSVTTSGVGAHEELRYRYTLQCVTDGCLPTSAAEPYALDARAVHGDRRAGTEQLSETATWPHDVRRLARVGEGRGEDPVPLGEDRARAGVRRLARTPRDRADRGRARSWRSARSP